MRDLEHIILARGLVGLGRANPMASYLEDALGLLTRLLETAQGAGWTGKMIEILALQAMAFDAKGVRTRAMQSVEKALALAEPEGYVRAFIDEGPPMLSLLQEAESQGLSPTYTEMLIGSFDTEAIKEKTSLPEQKLIDPLSARELDVLKMLATELSGPEISQELKIALPTLRFHTQNIYSKLNVNNRRSAVRRAQDLNLL
jgi:LuxR family maltose regulon positive regulatory protein